MGDEQQLAAFNLEGDWHKAAAEIIAMVKQGSTSSTGRILREGPASDLPLERMARAYCVNNPRVELPLVYGVLGVAVCTAAQGAITLYCPLKGGGWLKVPAIQHFIGVTPSGGRKSTTLEIGRKPLQSALAHGVKIRSIEAEQKMNLALAQATANAGPTNPFVDDKQFHEVFGSGRCAATIVKDPTVEALRNMVVHNGGIASVISAEADAFRNLTAYSPDGGSLTFFLDLWDQADVQTARVSAGSLTISNAALPMSVLLQTDVFAEVTAGSSRNMSVTSDSFVTRGMFGRTWVAEALTVTGHEEVADAYTDEDDFDFEDEDGVTVSGGKLTEYGHIVANFSASLDELVNMTNEYRLGKALHQAWQQASAKYGFGLTVPEQPEPANIPLKLDAAGRLAYRRVQRMQAAIETALTMAGEDDQVLWGPLAARFTQHVMREALVITLAARSTEISALIIEDCATRIIPWRWHLSMHALARREADRMEMVIETSLKNNPRGVDITSDGSVARAVASLMIETPQARTNGVTAAEVTARIRKSLPSKARNGAAAMVKSALDKLTADLDSGVYKAPPTQDSTGRPVERYLAKLPSNTKSSSPFD
jgi:hypothetical protein